MVTIVNANVFRNQYCDLLNLQGAINGIGRQVLNLLDGEPDIREAFSIEIDEIVSMCHCLGVVALRAANKAGEWEGWALREGIDTTP